MSWKISRAGVVNFWYYDEEEFNFEEGRLLLRGSNGSGKSVTMQSLVPLLFDGNKSPERLDPFGSKARKMENYLLSDGLDLDERTGYLFLEFEKKELNRYITIGMGMRARKNMALQTWYFILLDNKRIGKQYDFPLYKQLGDKIPLTQKELENKIGEGGQVFTKQSDYKNAVNEHLFGYKDISDFDELITLLIQIRSPKLSKEFKPTTMYEIMQNSLVTLTDDDLRPMSEAIENMDDIKLKIDALERSKKSLSRIQSVFDKYNIFMINTKASRYLQHLSNENQCKNQLKQMLVDQDNTQKKLKNIAEMLSKIEDEEVQLKHQEASLLSHNLSALATESDNLKNDVKRYEESLIQKNNTLERQKDTTNRLIETIRQHEDSLEDSKKQVESFMPILNEEADACAFDEHHFFLESHKNSKEPLDFKYHKKQVDTYKLKIKETAKSLRKQEEVSKQYDTALERLDKVTRDVAEKARHLKDTERQFNQVKEEFAEKVFSWAEKNNELNFSRTVLQQVIEKIFSYNKPYRFDQALEPLRMAYEEEKSTVYKNVHRCEAALEKKEDERKSLKEQHQKLKEQKEIEPERSVSTLKNRKRLQDMGIPFIPFYKSLDFIEGLSDQEKGLLEEAIDHLGILDALVVDPQYKNEVMQMEKGQSERYLFANPEFLSHNLTAFFKVENKEQPFDKPLIADMLMSVLVNEVENRFYITPDGYYGMGILKGKVSGETPSRFIGHYARKHYRELLLAEIQEKIDRVEKEVETIEKEIKDLHSLLSTMEKEWGGIPSNVDLEVAYTDYTEAHQNLSVLQKEEQHLRDQSEIVYEQLKSIKIEVATVSKGLYLKLTLEAYEEAEDAIENYANYLTEWKHTDEKISSIQSYLETLFIQKDESDIAEESLRYDISQFERLKHKVLTRLDDIESQLKLADYESIRQEIEKCKKRLEEIPLLYKEEVQRQADCNAASVQLMRGIDEKEKSLKILSERRGLYEKAFELEFDLGYVEVAEPFESLSNEEKAKHIVAQEGPLLQEKKTIMHYSDALKERFLSESGELAEYQMRFNTLFKEICDERCQDDDITHIERVDLSAKVQGKSVNFKELNQWIENQILESASLLDEQDRALFEEILINSISKKIGAKIYHSENWVKKIDELMNSMDTSSGLSFHLKWVTKEAESEDQLSTKELVMLLKGEQALLTRDQKDKLIRHFQSKINESKRRTEDEFDSRSFLAIMKDILDYRKWFEFRLDFTKKGERRRELTNNAFFTFSGGEKAMAMYVPLFSAVYAKYTGANRDCPKLVSLDEAFAGVDERNIRDMFRLLVKELDLGFIANSQVLFGDYDTVPSLGIYELIRPENATFVTSIHYKWNGRVRTLVSEV